jgi:hypothetical protein
MPSQPISSVSEAASELPSSRPGMSRNPAESALLRGLSQHWIDRTAVPTLAKLTACRKKCAVFNGAAARSQGRLPQNCNTHGQLTAAVAPVHLKMGPRGPPRKHYFGGWGGISTKVVGRKDVQGAGVVGALSTAKPIL